MILRMISNQNKKSHNLTSSHHFKSFDLKSYPTLHILILILEDSDRLQYYTHKDNYLTILHWNQKFGNLAFSVSWPKEWNNLPNSVRQCTSIAQFKKKLKMIYSHRAVTIDYNWLGT